jgi:hypothetical protein
LTSRKIVTKTLRRRREMIEAAHGIKVSSANPIATPKRGGLSATTRHAR